MYRQRQIIFLLLLLTGVAATILWIVVTSSDVAPHFAESPDAAERGGEGERATEAEPTTEAEPATEGRHTPGDAQTAKDDPSAPRLYLVLDDAGQSRDELQQFAAFPDVFTVAVLPELPFSAEISRMARALGHDVILHLPMEAFNGQDPGPGAIYADDTPEQIRAVLRRHFDAFPGVSGANNHMGSRVTSDPRTTEIVLQALQEERWFFLDSRTTHLSVVSEVAERLGMSVLTRHVFLDHERSREAIQSQLDLALDHARDQGEAILIGHIAVPETAEVLIERYAEIVAEGFRFLPISHAVATHAREAIH